MMAGQIQFCRTPWQYTSKQLMHALLYVGHMTFDNDYNFIGFRTAHQIPSKVTIRNFLHQKICMACKTNHCQVFMCPVTNCFLLILFFRQLQFHKSDTCKFGTSACNIHVCMYVLYAEKELANICNMPHKVFFRRAKGGKYLFPLEIDYFAPLDIQIQYMRSYLDILGGGVSLLPPYIQKMGQEGQTETF